MSEVVIQGGKVVEIRNSSEETIENVVEDIINVPIEDKDHVDTILKLKGLIESQEQTIKNLTNSLDSQDANELELTKYKDSMLDKDKQLVALNNEIKKLKELDGKYESKYNELNNLLKSEGVTIDSVLDLVHSRDESLNQMGNSNSQLIKELNTFESKIGKLETTIEKLETTIRENRHEVTVNAVKQVGSVGLLIACILCVITYENKKRIANLKKINKLKSELSDIVWYFNHTTDEFLIDIVNIDSITTLTKCTNNRYISKDIILYNM